MADFEAGLWPVDYGQASCTAASFGVLAPGETRSQLQIDCEDVAVNVLWNFTRRVLSTRTVTLRPSRETTIVRPSTFEGRGPRTNYPAFSGLQWIPLMIDGRWYNLTCTTCGLNCSCREPWSLELPGPVVSVTEVKIWAETLNLSLYWLDQGRLIIKEGRSWPTSQNRRRELGEEDTWGITYVQGIPVPRGGELAAGVLACELSKAVHGDEECALPSRVQTVTRQGVTIAILDAFEDLEKGRTGIPAVDLWIQAINQPRSAAALPMSPDYRRKIPR